MSSDRAHSAWRSAESIKKLSDRVIGVGPFGLGLDGLLTWIPGAGLVYSAGAGLFLLFTGLQAGAGLGTLARMAAYLLIDTATSEVPLVGDLADMLFPGHLMAANALQKDIEVRHGPPPELALARAGLIRRRVRGLGWLVLLTLAAFGLALHRSTFGELAGQGWAQAFRNAVLVVPERQVSCGIEGLCQGAFLTLPGLTVGVPVLAALTALVIVGLLALGRARR